MRMPPYKIRILRHQEDAWCCMELCNPHLHDMLLQEAAPPRAGRERGRPLPILQLVSLHNDSAPLAMHRRGVQDIVSTPVPSKLGSAGMRLSHMRACPSACGGHLREHFRVERRQELLREALLRLQPLGQHGDKPRNLAEAQDDALAGQVGQVAASIEGQQRAL